MLLYETTVNAKLQSKAINMRQFTIINNLLPDGLEYPLRYLQSQSWYTGLYLKLTSKTRARDIKGLVEQGLILITDDKKAYFMVIS